MRDSEQQYPFHQPARDGRHHPFDTDKTTPVDATPDLADEQPVRGAHKPVHQREHASTPELPKGRFLNTTITGAIIGILACIQNIVITVVNSSTFDAYTSTKDSTLKSALGFKIFGLGLIVFLISLVIYFLGGLVIGRLAVRRRLGFYGGFLAGAIYYLIASFLVRYIPAYPGNLATTSSDPLGTTAGIIFAAFLLILWGAVGGGMSLLGTWLATRRHPYYVGYSG